MWHWVRVSGDTKNGFAQCTHVPMYSLACLVILTSGPSNTKYPTYEKKVLIHNYLGVCICFWFKAEFNTVFITEVHTLCSSTIDLTEIKWNFLNSKWWGKSKIYRVITTSRQTERRQRLLFRYGFHTDKHSSPQSHNLYEMKRQLGCFSDGESEK